MASPWMERLLSQGAGPPPDPMEEEREEGKERSPWLENLFSQAASPEPRERERQVLTREDIFAPPEEPPKEDGPGAREVLGQALLSESERRLERAEEPLDLQGKAEGAARAIAAGTLRTGRAMGRGLEAATEITQRLPPPFGGPPVPEEEMREAFTPDQIRAMEAPKKALEGAASVSEAAEAVVKPPALREDFRKALVERPIETIAAHSIYNLPGLVATLGAAAAGGPVAGAGAAWLQEAGSEYEQSGDVTAAGLTGTANMVLEYLPAGRALSKLAGGAKKEAAGWLRNILGQALSEGATESVQELNQRLAQLATYAGEEGFTWNDLKSAFSVENLQEYGFSGLIGAVLGGGVGAVTSAAAPAEPPAQAPPPEEAAPALEEATTPDEPEISGVEPPEAPSHAGQAGESPEAIARVERGERYFRVTPGGETLPIPNTVDAVDMRPNPGEAKVRISRDGVLDIEEGGKGTMAQRAAISRLSEGAAPELAETLLPTEEVEPQTFELDVGEGLPSEVPETQDQEQAPETVIERLPAADPDRTAEAGFVRRPEGVVRDLGSFVRKHVAEGGNLPKSAWNLKLQKDHNLAAHEKGLQFRLRELNRKIRTYEGPLNRKQLTQYLGDALRGNVPIQMQAETSQLDETQIQRIADRRGIDPETVRSEVERAGQAQGGLGLAPEFVETISKLRADIDGVTRSLRREGLLDDAMARRLEREYGLYTHRSFEAFRGESKRYLRRVEQEPLWNRAKEIVAKEHPSFTEEEVDGLLRKLIERGDRPTLPGNVPEGAKNRSTLFQRKTIRDLERLLLGERRDIRSQAVDTLIGQVALLEHERFLKALREDGLGSYLFERETGRFYRPIDEEAVAIPVLEEEGQPGIIHRRMGAKRTSPVSGLHTRPEILEELEKAGPKPSEFPLWLKIWSMGNLAVKLNLTAGSPQTTARNYQSNLLPAITNGYLPVGEAATEALNLISRDLFNSSAEDVRERLSYYRSLGLIDQNADYGDLRRLGQFADVMRIEKDPGNRLISWTKATLRKTGDLYSHGDNFWKILGWHKERARLSRANPDWSQDLLDQEAAKIIRRTLQNYSELPRVARAISANPVVAPFFSFTWAMVRGTKNTAEQAVQEIRSDNPSTRATGMKRAAGLTLGLSLPEMMSHVMAWWSNTDDEDRKALREFVYPWDRNANLGIVHHEPGRYVYFNWGFMDYFGRLKEPIYAIHRALTTDTPTEDIIAELGQDFGEEVLLGSIIDATRGETASGFPVWLETDSRTQKLAKGLEHIWETGRPGAARSAERITEGAQGHRTLWPELVALIGPRIVDVDFKESLGRYGSHFTRQLSGATRQYTQFANRRQLRDPDDLIKGYRRANEVRGDLIRELKRKIDAGLQSGLSLDQVENSLVDGGLAQKYLDMAYQGRITPLDYERGPHWMEYEDQLSRISGEFR